MMVLAWSLLAVMIYVKLTHSGSNYVRPFSNESSSVSGTECGAYRISTMYLTLKGKHAYRRLPVVVASHPRRHRPVSHNSTQEIPGTGASLGRD